MTNKFHRVPDHQATVTIPLVTLLACLTCFAFGLFLGALI